MNERTSIGAGTLRIDFIREADRYRHEVWECRGDSSRLLLSSIEGVADEAWPASPPLQELHIEQRTESEVALLVGRAGRSHWSLSVEADPARQSLVFDVACRAVAVDNCLRSSYRLEIALPANLSGGAPIALASNYGLQISDGDVDAGPDDPHLLRIIPQQRKAVTGKVETFRWRYHVR